MKELAKLLNEMRAAGIITNYALFEAIAQMRYTAPVATLDADVLVALPSEDRLDVLAPIYEWCHARGYANEGEGVRVGAWPVQFIPAFSPLTVEAMTSADTVDFEGESLRVVKAVYLAVIALSVGRAKDHARILALLESGSVTHDDIARLARRFDFGPAWERFLERFDEA